MLNLYRIPSLHKFLLSKYPLETWWSFLNVGSLGVGLCFFVSILFTYNWGMNPVLWRVFYPNKISNSISPGEHHTLIIILFCLMFYASLANKVNPFLYFI